MRFKFVPALVAISLAFAGAAYASTTTNGQIKAIDQSAHTLTLADGTVYQLPSGFNAAAFKAGDKVAVIWNMKGSMHEASSVTLQK